MVIGQSQRLKEKTRSSFDWQAPAYDRYFSRHARALHAGVLAELRTESFHSLLNIGCGASVQLDLLCYEKEIALTGMWRVLRSRNRLILSNLWLPELTRRLPNALLFLSPTGDVRVYSELKLSVMVRQSGFTVRLCGRVTWRGFLPVACLQKGGQPA